jgi:cation:H+ antiporter
MPDILLVLLGLTVLVAAGEATLRGAVGLARKLNIPPAAIGLTIVGFGTSLPELVVSVQAAFDARPGFAVGNAVGSNIANCLLILGCAALVRPLRCEPRSLRRDGGAMLVATLICIALGLSGQVVFWQGGLMIVLLFAFIGWSYQQDRKWADLPAALHEKEGEAIEVVPESTAFVVAMLLSGLAGLGIGADMMVEGAAAIGARAGIPDAVLGAVGNVIGSNIFNLMGILGVASLVTPIPFNDALQQIDLWVLLAATLVLFPIIITGWRISRREGTLLLCCYIGYIASIAWRTS